MHHLVDGAVYILVQSEFMKMYIFHFNLIKNI